MTLVEIQEKVQAYVDLRDSATYSKPGTTLYLAVHMDDGSGQPMCHVRAKSPVVVESYKDADCGHCLRIHGVSKL